MSRDNRSVSHERQHEMEEFLTKYVMKPVTENNLRKIKELCLRFKNNPYYSPFNRACFQLYLAVYADFEKWDEE